MLTRARARATNQYVFVDEKWNDAYIQTKDEQIDMLHAQRRLKGWDQDDEELHGVESEQEGGGGGSDDDDGDDDEDQWESDDEDDDEEEEEEEKDDEEENATRDTEQSNPRKGRSIAAAGMTRHDAQAARMAWLAAGGWLENVAWTAAAMSVAPVLVYALASQCRRRRKRVHARVATWPLQSHSLAGTLFKAYTNVATLALVAIALHWALGGGCVSWVSLLPSLKVARAYGRSLLAMGRAWLGTFTAAVTAVGNGSGLGGLKNASGTVPGAWLYDGKWTKSPVDWLSATAATAMASLAAMGDAAWALLPRVTVTPTTVVATLAVGLVLTQFHRVWFKTLVLNTAAGLMVIQGVTQQQAERRAAVEITALDPTFAFVNESIFISIDGQNLEQGGTITWVPFWGGAQLRNANQCAQQFAQPLRNGGVLVTFDQLNEFVPCYRGPRLQLHRPDHPNPRSNEAIACFEHLRLRVKDEKSIPGWSLYAETDAQRRQLDQGEF